MSSFLQLHETSPAAALMASLVRLCDDLAEPVHMLDPALTAALFRANALAAHALLASDAASRQVARAAVAAAAKR